VQLQVLLDKLGERGRATAARTDPIERLPESLLCFRASREPAHLRPTRTSSFEPIPVRPQRLPIRALRLELEHLTLLDHLGTSSIDNEIEESHPCRDDDHLSR
jgi:hypothetical protein